MSAHRRCTRNRALPQIVFANRATLPEQPPRPSTDERDSFFLAQNGHRSVNGTRWLGPLENPTTEAQKRAAASAEWATT
jgi:CHASE1-domain containing sensor protein